MKKVGNVRKFNSNYPEEKLSAGGIDCNTDNVIKENNIHQFISSTKNLHLHDR